MKGRAKEAFAAYRRDLRFRAEVTLYANLAVNSVFAIFEAVCGFLLRSPWMGNLAFYYIVLSLLRFLILRSYRKNSNRRCKWRVYRLCGLVLLTLTVALAGMHILTSRQVHAIVYFGYMIYAVALYTFYAVICAVRNVVVYRKMDDPILQAAKAISLAVAAVSVYSLQSAMITAFGQPGEEAFRVVMGNCTAAGVFLIIIAISVVMVWRANRALEQIQKR